MKNINSLTAELFSPFILNQFTLMEVRRCLHDTGTRFIPVGVHSGSIQITAFVYMTLQHFSYRNDSFRNELIPVLAPDRNFQSGMKSDHNSVQYHVKSVQVHTGTKMAAKLDFQETGTDRACALHFDWTMARLQSL